MYRDGCCSGCGATAAATAAADASCRGGGSKLAKPAGAASPPPGPVDLCTAAAAYGCAAAATAAAIAAGGAATPPVLAAARCRGSGGGRGCGKSPRLWAAAAALKAGLTVRVADCNEACWPGGRADCKAEGAARSAGGRPSATAARFSYASAASAASRGVGAPPRRRLRSDIPGPLKSEITFDWRRNLRECTCVRTHKDQRELQPPVRSLDQLAVCKSVSPPSFAEPDVIPARPTFCSNTMWCKLFCRILTYQRVDDGGVAVQQRLRGLVYLFFCRQSVAVHAMQCVLGCSHTNNTS